MPQREQPRQRDAQTPPAPQSQQVILLKAGTPAAEKFLSATERREREKRKQTAQRRLARQEEALLSSLEALETEKAALEASLSLPEVYSSGEKAKAAADKLAAVLAAIEEKNAQWSNLLQ
jgi:ATP-binding cassette subfamily F protein 3